MFGIEDSTLVVQLIGSIDEQGSLLPKSKFWGIVLQRDETATFITIGNHSEFKRYFSKMDYDTVQMLVSAVHGSDNVTALELLDQVVIEQERFVLNGDWFTWKDIQEALGVLGADGSFTDDGEIIQ